MIDLKAVAEHCRLNRLARHVTQEDAAQMLGTSTSTLNRFEQGRVDSYTLVCRYLEQFPDRPGPLPPGITPGMAEWGDLR